MRKYIILIVSIFLILLSIFSIYKANSPQVQVGPIGNGEMSALNWALILFPLILGLLFLVQAIYLFSNKNKQQ